MKRISGSVVGVALVVGVLAVAGAQGPKDAVFVDSKNAEYKEVVPGVKKTVLWGDHDTGPYGAFTRFASGLKNPLHTHSSDVRIVVIQGAYIYKPQNGKERRVGPGAFISVPAGDVHTSAGDAKEGALFYEESPGKFDLKPVDKK